MFQKSNSPLLMFHSFNFIVSLMILTDSVRCAMRRTAVQLTRTVVNQAHRTPSMKNLADQTSLISEDVASQRPLQRNMGTFCSKACGNCTRKNEQQPHYQYTGSPHMPYDRPLIQRKSGKTHDFLPTAKECPEIKQQTSRSLDDLSIDFKPTTNSMNLFTRGLHTSSNVQQKSDELHERLQTAFGPDSNPDMSLKEEFQSKSKKKPVEESLKVCFSPDSNSDLGLKKKLKSEKKMSKEEQDFQERMQPDKNGVYPPFFDSYTYYS
ncbi:hypothetical protein M153_5960001187 [Pseudoloma neurophilia]|uniref:Uncharacterized protein n=1 Tax=Pseudoloma neurophilia TaxID=146866 RepID=A0A0R0M4G5_9MICR|nr:hypothetical protein M153_5960001187 [Pseudoloma neurophilia]